MEALALSHSFVAYESTESELKLKSLDELGLKIPNSAWIGVASMAIALSIVSIPGEAQAGGCYSSRCGSGHHGHHNYYAQVDTNGGRLNIRHRANRCSHVIGKLYNGDKIALTGRHRRGWAELADGGWVSKKWIY